MVLAREVVSGQVHIGGALVGAGLVSVAYEVWVKRDWMTYVREAVGIEADLADAGLCGVGKSRNQEMLSQLLQGAAKVDLVVAAGGQLLPPCGPVLVQVIEAGAKTRVILLEPGCEALRLTQKEENTDSISREVWRTSKFVQAAAEKSKRSTLAIFHCPLIARYWVAIRDEERACLGLYLWHRDQLVRPYVLVSRRDATGWLVNSCQEHFAHVLSKSKCVYERTKGKTIKPLEVPPEYDHLGAA
jgi:hypothetical protein